MINEKGQTTTDEGEEKVDYGTESTRLRDDGIDKQKGKKEKRVKIKRERGYSLKKRAVVIGCSAIAAFTGAGLLGALWYKHKGLVMSTEADAVLKSKGLPDLEVYDRARAVRIPCKTVKDDTWPAPFNPGRGYQNPIVTLREGSGVFDLESGRLVPESEGRKEYSMNDPNDGLTLRARIGELCIKRAKMLGKKIPSSTTVTSAQPIN